MRSGVPSGFDRADGFAERRLVRRHGAHEIAVANNHGILEFRLASLPSNDASFALNAGGRSTRPCSMPGRARSEVKRCAPVTMSRALTFGADVPSSVHSARRSNGCAIHGLYQLLAVRQLAESDGLAAHFILTLPSATVMDARSTFHFSAARSISASRAAAPTFFICGAISGVVRLPKVPMSYGVRSVSAITSCTEANGRAQLFGHRLRQRSPDVLAYFRLAREDGNGAIFADVQPSGQFGRPRVGTECRAASGFLRAR